MANPADDAKKGVDEAVKNIPDPKKPIGPHTNAPGDGGDDGDDGGDSGGHGGKLP